MTGVTCAGDLDLALKALKPLLPGPKDVVPDILRRVFCVAHPSRERESLVVVSDRRFAAAVRVAGADLVGLSVAADRVADARRALASSCVRRGPAAWPGTDGAVAVGGVVRLDVSAELEDASVLGRAVDLLVAADSGVPDEPVTEAAFGSVGLSRVVAAAAVCDAGVSVRFGNLRRPVVVRAGDVFTAAVMPSTGRSDDVVGALR